MTFIIRAHGANEKFPSNRFFRIISYEIAKRIRPIWFISMALNERFWIKSYEIKYILQFFLQILYFFQYCLWNNKCFAW